MTKETKIERLQRLADKARRAHDAFTTALDEAKYGRAQMKRCMEACRNYSQGGGGEIPELTVTKEWIELCEAAGMDANSDAGDWMC